MDNIKIVSTQTAAIRSALRSIVPIIAFSLMEFVQVHNIKSWRDLLSLPTFVSFVTSMLVKGGFASVTAKSQVLIKDVPELTAPSATAPTETQDGSASSA
jgi:hypothetical protein